MWTDEVIAEVIIKNSTVFIIVSEHVIHIIDLLAVEDETVKQACDRNIQRLIIKTMKCIKISCSRTLYISLQTKGREILL